MHKPDLENQIQLITQWCFSNGIQLNRIFSDVVSGISFEKSKNLFKMLEDILQKRVKKVIITYKDRLKMYSKRKRKVIQELIKEV